MAFLIVFLLLAGGTLVYLRQYPLVQRDVLLLGFSFSLVFFLSRFNGLATVWIDRFPLAGLHLYLLALLAVLLVVRGLDGRPLSRSLALPLPFLGFYAVLTLLSGVVNGGLDGVPGAVQVIVITLTPPLLAWVLVELVRAPAREPAALRRQFILPLGVVTPSIMVVSALLPGLFRNLLGWGLTNDFGGFEGFVRGWSPLGSTILTGCLVIAAAGFALHEAVVRRSGLHRFIVAVSVASLLFTASRAVMIFLVIFNVLYWGLVRRWGDFRRVAGLPAVILLVIVGWSVVTGQVSFGRFLKTADQSTSRRAESALAAIELGRERPLVGHGPGRVYTEIRTTWVKASPLDARIMEKPIGMHISAMEPHNMYLWLWAEHGLLAGAAFVLALVAPLVSLWRLDPRGDPEAASARAVYVALLAGFLVVFLTSSWLLLTPQFACFYWLFVFTGLHAAARVRGEDGA